MVCFSDLPHGLLHNHFFSSATWTRHPGRDWDHYRAAASGRLNPLNEDVNLSANFTRKCMMLRKFLFYSGSLSASMTSTAIRNPWSKYPRSPNYLRVEERDDFGSRSVRFEWFCIFLGYFSVDHSHTVALAPVHFVPHFLRGHLCKRSLWKRYRLGILCYITADLRFVVPAKYNKCQLCNASVSGKWFTRLIGVLSSNHMQCPSRSESHLSTSSWFTTSR